MCVYFLTMLLLYYQNYYLLQCYYYTITFCYNDIITIAAIINFISCFSYSENIVSQEYYHILFTGIAHMTISDKDTAVLSTTILRSLGDDQSGENIFLQQRGSRAQCITEYSPFFPPLRVGQFRERATRSLQTIFSSFASLAQQRGASRVNSAVVRSGKLQALTLFPNRPEGVVFSLSNRRRWSCFCSNFRIRQSGIVPLASSSPTIILPLQRNFQRLIFKCLRSAE